MWYWPGRLPKGELAVRTVVTGLEEEYQGSVVVQAFSVVLQFGVYILRDIKFDFRLTGMDQLNGTYIHPVRKSNCGFFLPAPPINKTMRLFYKNPEVKRYESLDLQNQFGECVDESTTDDEFFSDFDVTLSAEKITVEGPSITVFMFGEENAANNPQAGVSIIARNRFLCRDFYDVTKRTNGKVQIDFFNEPSSFSFHCMDLIQNELMEVGSFESELIQL